MNVSQDFAQRCAHQGCEGIAHPLNRAVITTNCGIFVVCLCPFHYRRYVVGLAQQATVGARILHSERRAPQISSTADLRAHRQAKLHRVTLEQEGADFYQNDENGSDEHIYEEKRWIL